MMFFFFCFIFKYQSQLASTIVLQCNLASSTKVILTCLPRSVQRGLATSFDLESFRNALGRCRARCRVCSAEDPKHRLAHTYWWSQRVLYSGPSCSYSLSPFAGFHSKPFRQTMHMTSEYMGLMGYKPHALASALQVGIAMPQLAA
jgi:hypothetical protein